MDASQDRGENLAGGRLTCLSAFRAITIYGPKMGAPPGIGGRMTKLDIDKPRSAMDFGNQFHAYDPVRQPQLFDGVIRKRIVAFVVDAIVISFLTVIAYVVVAVLGVVTLGLAWLLFGLVFPAVGLGYNAITIGGRNSATVGQRIMGLEVRMWYGGKVTPLIAAFHALLFWFSLVIFCPILLWAFFDPRKRCVHDILAGVVVVNRL
jgi:uncharacterized RDD family membrane protein YckC